MRALLVTALLLAGAAVNAEERSLVFLAGAHHTMPLSQFEDGKLVAGIVKDVGDAIAQRLGRSARYISVPPKRVPLMLENGEADSVCYVMPEWIDGQFNWTKGLIPGHGVLVARTTAPRLHSIADLAGQTVGTVAAYRYKSLDAELGPRLRRDDAPFMANNVQKLLAGRMQYAVMERMTYDYLMRGPNKPPLRVDLEFDPIRAQCAFSRKSRIPFEEVERAVKGLIEDGSVERILARYR